MFVDGRGEVALYDNDYNAVHFEDGVGVARDDGFGTYGPWSVFKDAGGNWYQLGDDFHVRPMVGIPQAAPLFAAVQTVKGPKVPASPSDPNLRAAQDTADSVRAFFSQSLRLGEGFSIPYWMLAGAGIGVVAMQRRRRRR